MFTPQHFGAHLCSLRSLSIVNITVFDMSLGVCRKCTVTLEAARIHYEIPAHLYSLFKCNRALTTKGMVTNKGMPDSISHARKQISDT